MTENSDQRESIEGTDSELRDVRTQSVSSTWKVLGEFTEVNGVGVLGQNNAQSGTPIGVQGAVPNAFDGYGLATPDDVRIEGVVDTNETDFVVEAGTTSTNDARNVVAGHAENQVIDNAVGATITGGGWDDGTSARRNYVSDNYGTVSGGWDNIAGDPEADPTNAQFASVGGGRRNSAGASDATVGGGKANTASGINATVGGGSFNDATASHATIAGGGSVDNSDATGNVVHDNYGTVGGGGNNQAGSDDSDPGTARFATVGGGENNTASGDRSTVGGGNQNTASAISSTVPGGQNCTADGDYSFATGRLAESNGNGGTFVFGDSSSTTVQATSSDQVVFQAGGTRTSGTAVEFYSQSDGSAGVKLAANDGTWQSLSSRTAKSDVDPVAGPDVLDAVQELEVSTWRYDGQDDSVRHMGPMAEDFHNIFGLGTDEETIAALDLAGVALAAIQGLTAELDEKDRRIEQLETRLDSVEKRLTASPSVPESTAPADE